MHSEPATARRLTVYYVLLIAACTAQPSTNHAGDRAVSFGLPISAVSPVAVELAVSVLEEVSTKTKQPAHLLSRATFRRCRFDTGSESVSASVAIVPLAGSLDGARVAVVVANDMHVLGIRVGGTEDFDSDPTDRWRLFCKRLQRSAGKAPNLTLAYDQVDAMLESLERSSPSDARLAALLVRTRTGMSRVSMVVELVSGMTKRNQRPPPQWLDPIVDDFVALADGQELLTSTVGVEGAAQLANHAAEARDAFSGFRTALNGPLQPAKGFLRPHIRAGLCSTCHHGRSPGIEGEWRDILASRADALGIPRGMMMVSFDTPRASGDDGTISRRIATAARGAVLLIHRSLDQLTATAKSKP